jgi:hypothetical protein
LSDAWIGVVAALGGVALTGLIALATATLNHRWTASATRETRTHELGAQLAEVRRVAYARFLAAWQNFRESLDATTPPDEAKLKAVRYEELVAEWFIAHGELMRDYHTANAEAILVAGGGVFNALEAFDEAAGKYVFAVVTSHGESRTASGKDLDDTRAALVQAMRQEQSTDLAM